MLIVIMIIIAVQDKVGLKVPLFILRGDGK